MNPRRPLWWLWRCVDSEPMRGVVVERNRLTGAYRRRDVNMEDCQRVEPREHRS